MIAVLLVAWQLFATSGPMSIRNAALQIDRGAFPTPCVKANPLSIAAAGDPGSWDYKALAKYCSVGEVPAYGYAAAVDNWTIGYRTKVWDNIMPVLLLFLGILIAVGAPFAGESSEASTLTFSLPWTRVDWLTKKIKLSAGLLVGLVSVAYIGGALSYHFPGVSSLSYAASLETSLQTPWDTMPSLIAGFVGLSLGITASMLTRNALAGAVAASLIAYLLALVDWSILNPHEIMQTNMVIMDLTKPSGALAAIVVAAGAIALTIVRLERTDF
jgi:hypothetical protein